MISVFLLIIFGPLILIFGWMALIDEIKQIFHLGKYKDGSNYHPKYTMGSESAREESRRIDEYGLDDDWRIP